MRTTDVDRLRQLLCFEPRGHADMYGGFMTPPDDDGSAHSACCSGTRTGSRPPVVTAPSPSASGRCNPGWSAADGGVTDVPIDVPSGRVTARVHTTDRHDVTAVDFLNVASYVVATDVGVDTSRGHVHVDIGFGGANYAQVRASRSRACRSCPQLLAELIAIGREIKWCLIGLSMPSTDRQPVDGIYGTTLYEELGAGRQRQPAPAQRHHLRRRRRRSIPVRIRDRCPRGRARCPMANSADQRARARLDRRLTVRGRRRRARSTSTDPRSRYRGSRGRRIRTGRACLRRRPRRPDGAGIRAALVRRRQ